MNPNRHERRKASSKNKLSKMSTAKLLDKVSEIAASSYERTGRLLQGIRMTALHKSDVVYQKPVLLVSSKLIAFGEASEVAVGFKEVGLRDGDFNAFDLSNQFGGKTVKEVSERFLKNEDAMQEALTFVLFGLTSAAEGIANDEVISKGAESMETVFNLLGIPRKYHS